MFQAIQKGEIKAVSSLSENIFYTLLISLIIMIIQNTFTLIPLIFVITLNYYSFGFLNGFIWSWLSSVVAAVIVFYAVRFWFQDMIIRQKHHDFIKKIEKKGTHYVFYGRVFPFFPTSLLNIIAGISTISIKAFIIGTLIGNFIYFFILSLIPFGLFSTDIPPALIIILIALAILLFYLLKKTKPAFLQQLKKEKEKSSNI
ncbi:TVP38/TMEM64 family protein [Niallia nealsonii]|nr:VTT domain-containing protein [Niallia nealsonii]